MRYGPAYSALLEELVSTYKTEDQRGWVANACQIPKGTIDLSGAPRDAIQRLLAAVHDRGLASNFHRYLDEVDHPNNHILPLLDAWIAEIEADTEAASAPVDPRTETALGDGWIDPALLPKLIDRTRTSQRLILCGTEAIRVCLAGDAAQRHCGFVVIGRADDAMEALVDRFVKWDSKQTWLDNEAALAAHGGWADAREWRAAEIKVELTGEPTEADLAEELQIPTQLALGAGGLHDRFPDAALLAVTSVTLGRHQRLACAVAAAWRVLWNARLKQPVTQPVLPVLCLVHDAEPEDRRGLLGLFRRDNPNADDPRCKSTFDALNAAHDACGSLDVAIGNALGRIEPRHFTSWKSDQRLSARIPNGKYRMLHDLGTSLFGEQEKPRRVRKQVFVEQVELLAIFADEPEPYRSEI